MIRRIDGLPTGVFGFEVREPATQDEFDDVANAFDATISESYEIALLMDVHPDVKSLSVIEKSQFENRLAARGRVRRFAVVGGVALRNDFGGFTEFVGCDLRMFPSGARNAALEWLLGEPFVRDRDGLT